MISEVSTNVSRALRVITAGRERCHAASRGGREVAEDLDELDPVEIDDRLHADIGVEAARSPVYRHHLPDGEVRWERGVLDSRREHELANADISPRVLEELEVQDAITDLRAGDPLDTALLEPDPD